MENPKISIIVPVYNVEKYIRRCLDSIAAQTFTDWECICVDDGTPDASGKICDEYAQKDSRFVVIHKENGGVSSARNVGLDVAKGEWITFCDSDDYVEENWLSEQYSDITSGNYDVVVCGFYGKGKPIKRVLNRVSAKYSIFSDGGIGGYSFLRLIRRRNVEKFRYDTSIAFMEDSEFFYRLFDNCERILWTDKPLYHYVDNPDSVTRYLGISEQAKTCVQMLDCLYKHEKNRRLKSAIDFSRKQTRLHLCVVHLLGNGDTKEKTFIEYKLFLKKEFLNFFCNIKLGIKHKIILLCICFKKNPYNSFSIKYMKRKRSRKIQN